MDPDLLQLAVDTRGWTNEAVSKLIVSAIFDYMSRRPFIKLTRLRTVMSLVCIPADILTIIGLNPQSPPPVCISDAVTRALLRPWRRHQILSLIR